MCLGAEPPRQQCQQWMSLDVDLKIGDYCMSLRIDVQGPKSLSPRSNKQNKQGLNETP